METGSTRAAALALALLLPLSSQASKISDARLQLVGGFAIFELYDDPEKLAACNGGNALAARARVEKEGHTYHDGTGWGSADPGSIELSLQNENWRGALSMSRILPDIFS
ncbi:hypothetical protein HF313_22575 [Massilia atriviolacea]|uniref:Uncharacterized protein n=1 Tax=Massilia atriviolacea TaxID=2495579 RepID=A0A430HFP3_9BURK|nr:hypothetical protein [Massilia atriviolacea]RSZ56335.1 hypothetical protein EJB06_24745 [Massilia atriviolacea]